MPFRREQENGIAVAIVQELVVCYAADIPMYMMKQIVWSADGQGWIPLSSSTVLFLHFDLWNMGFAVTMTAQPHNCKTLLIH